MFKGCVDLGTVVRNFSQFLVICVLFIYFIYIFVIFVHYFLVEVEGVM